MIFFMTLLNMSQSEISLGQFYYYATFIALIRNHLNHGLEDNFVRMKKSVQLIVESFIDYCQRLNSRHGKDLKMSRLQR